MFSLTEINALKQYLGTITNTVWFVVDIPNPASPTGYDTQKVNLQAIQGFQNFIDLLDTPIAYGAVGDTLVVNAAQNGLEFVAASGGSNLGDSDLSSTDAIRQFTLNGTTNASRLVFKDVSGATIMQINGDKSVFIPTGNLTVGDTTTGATNGADKLRVVAGTSSHGIHVETTKPKGIGIITEFEPTSANGKGIRVQSGSTVNVVKTGVQIDVSGGGTNIALEIENGDIKLPSGNLGFTGSAFYTYFVIENGIITSAS